MPKKQENNEQPVQGAMELSDPSITSTDVVKEMEEGYLDYAMSVIVARALPDVRDGLKPVHRRILYAMHELGMSPGSKYKKSARLVGDVLGKYHPHGDTSVYDAMVRMAQDFSLRYPLVDGQGNFGSVDGDGAAAMRYCVTEDTLILTDKGMMPIKEISNKKEAAIDLGVLSFDGTKNRASKFFNSGKHKTIKITTKEGYSIEGSYNHPVLTWKVGSDFRPTISWKLLEDLSEGDIVIINRGTDLFSDKPLDLRKYFPKSGFKNDIKLPLTMNNDLAFLLGALVSEGSFHNNQVLFNNKDMTFYNKIKSIILSQFKGVQLYERNIKGGCKELSIYEQKIVLFLINIGLKCVKSDKKEIPFSVLQSTKSNVKHFLTALFEGDGSVQLVIDKRHGGKSVQLTYHSKSEKLIKQLKTVLLNFGVISAFPYKDKRNNCLKLYASSYDNILKFHKEIGFFSAKKNKVLSQIKKINPSRLSKTDFIPFINDYLRNKYDSGFILRNNFDRYNSLSKNYHSLLKEIDKSDRYLIETILKNNFYFNQLIKVERTKGLKEVFSVKVESSCHSFIANGFANHNTEARMAKIAPELIDDIEKETIDFQDNYDGSQQEPTVLPAKLPQLLLNGVGGIAVGMATNIPPHNIGEIIDGIIEVIDNPDCTIDDLIKKIPAPDFPTGGIIYDQAEIKRGYATGKGKVVIRGKAEIIENDKGKNTIIITEIPYQVNKSNLITKIADLVQNKIIVGISDLRDESDREGMRVVIELKKDAYPKKILNQIYKMTQLQETFHMNMIALVADGKQPRLLSLKAILEEYIKHRKKVLTRKTEYELKVAQARAHILEGLKVALDNIDAVIKTIRAAKTKEDAKEALIKKFKLSEKQAQAILEMRLQTLAGLERKKIEDEFKEKMALIGDLKDILKKPARILNIIRTDLAELKTKYADERKSQIVPEGLDGFRNEDLIPNEPMILTLTEGNYIKRMPTNVYKAQHRGGKGIIGMTTKEEDEIRQIVLANNHDDLLMFTDKGRVFKLKVYDVPQSSRTAKGQALVNIIQLEQGEQVKTILALPKGNVTQDKCLFMATIKGTVKKTPLEDFKNVRKSGLIAIKLRDADLLNWVQQTEGNTEIMLITQQGQSIRFKEGDVRPMGRPSMGVRGIKLKKEGDAVVQMSVIKPGMDKALIMTITENGFGKCTALPNYTAQRRGGSGLKTHLLTKKTGIVIGARIIIEKEGDLILISQQGQVIRLNLAEIKTAGRATQGVTVMRMKDKQDRVSSLAVYNKEDIENEEKEEEKK